MAQGQRIKFRYIEWMLIVYKRFWNKLITSKLMPSFLGGNSCFYFLDIVVVLNATI